MFKKMIGKLFGNKQDRDVATYQPIVDEINVIFAGLSNLSNDELRNRTHTFRARIAAHAVDPYPSPMPLRRAGEVDFERVPCVSRVKDAPDAP